MCVCLCVHDAYVYVSCISDETRAPPSTKKKSATKGERGGEKLLGGPPSYPISNLREEGALPPRTLSWCATVPYPQKRHENG